jgi:hypothetical protein
MLSALSCLRSRLWKLQVGNIMAEYPLDPQLAKMVTASPEFRSGRCSARRALAPPALAARPPWLSLWEAAAKKLVSMGCFHAVGCRAPKGSSWLLKSPCRRCISCGDQACGTRRRVMKGNMQGALKQWPVGDWCVVRARA